MKNRDFCLFHGRKLQFKHQNFPFQAQFSAHNGVQHTQATDRFTPVHNTGRLPWMQGRMATLIETKFTWHSCQGKQCLDVTLKVIEIDLPLLYPPLFRVDAAKGHPRNNLFLFDLAAPLDKADTKFIKPYAFLLTVVIVDDGLYQSWPEVGT